MTLKHCTPPCTPHMKVPPHGNSHFQNNELFCKITLVFRYTWYSAKSSYSAKSRYFTKSSYSTKSPYSIKSSYSDIMHFLYSVCILQSPVSNFKFLLFQNVEIIEFNQLLVDSNFNAIIQISIINCLCIPN